MEPLPRFIGSNIEIESALQLLRLSTTRDGDKTTRDIIAYLLTA